MGWLLLLEHPKGVNSNACRIATAQLEKFSLDIFKYGAYTIYHINNLML